MKTQQKSPKRKIILVLLLVFVLAAGGVLLYKQHQKSEAITKERAQYAQAEKELDALSAQIIAKLGQPDDQKKVKECGYTSDTFELAPQGDLFCNVGWQFDYKATDIRKAQELSQQAQSLNNTNIQVDLVTDEEVEQSMQSFATTPVDLGGASYIRAGLKCFTAFSLRTLNGSSSITNNDSLMLHIEMNCAAKSPLAKYYPVKAF